MIEPKLESTNLEHGREIGRHHAKRGRFVRNGIVVSLLVVFVIWIWGLRNVDGLPDVGDPFDVTAARQPIDIADSDNAYALYVEAKGAMQKRPAALAWIFHPPLGLVPDVTHKQIPVGFAGGLVNFRPAARKTPYPPHVRAAFFWFSPGSTRSCRLRLGSTQYAFKHQTVQILERVAGGQVKHDSPDAHDHLRRHLKQLQPDRPDLGLLQIRAHKRHSPQRLDQHVRCRA
jgi:hypothetical protein